MSYVVTIRRVVTAEELLSVVENDEELELIDPAAGYKTFVWRAQGEDARFTWSDDGCIDITSPSDGALEKARQIAETLGARVFGEEGEDLTESDDYAQTIPRDLQSGRREPENSGKVTEMWLGWPIVTIVLVILLIWRW